jgi:protoporphyrinogen oxidase
MNIAVIGAGISGLSIANLLSKKANVVVYETESTPGGLVRCDRVQGSLFHRTGGHVFNTRRDDVFDWFWNFFDKEHEFTKARRNSSISMVGGEMVSYPIENHVYMLNDLILKSVLNDFLKMSSRCDFTVDNFGDFLKKQFGETLYKLYFEPYNYKIWRKDLKKIPLSWLNGKLPVPTVYEMIYNNIKHVEEQAFVHSSFYYPLNGGSQFIANRLAENLNIRYSTHISRIIKNKKSWLIDGESYDLVIFCGNIKYLPALLSGQIEKLKSYQNFIQSLDSHGTTSVFCEIDKNDYSWIYMPSNFHFAHRIICTGNFSSNNNALGLNTATVEFTDLISKSEILDNLERIPYNPKYLGHNYEKYTYPIQNSDTRRIIQNLKIDLKDNNIYLLGRFAEWEYYNMDVAMGAAIDLEKEILYSL